MAAGCLAGSGSEHAPLQTGTAPDAPVYAPPTFDDATGAIAGTVANDEGLPVTGANVTLKGPDRLAITDASGRFAYANVPAGTYLLLAVGPGYVNASREVTVIVGQITDAVIVIVRAPTVEPYHLTAMKAGEVYCGFAVNATQGNFPGDPCMQTLLGTGNTFNFTAPDWTGFTEARGEMIWTSTQALAGGLEVARNLEGVYKTCHWGQVTLPMVGGSSPLRFSLNASEVFAASHAWACTSAAKNATCGNGMYCAFTPAVRSFTSGVAAFTLEQKYEIYHTLFFFAPAPNGFTALPD